MFALSELLTAPPSPVSRRSMPQCQPLPLLILMCGPPPDLAAAAAAQTLTQQGHRIIWVPWLQHEPDVYAKAKRIWPEADIIVYPLRPPWRPPSRSRE